jgi:hypothetical protein
MKRKLSNFDSSLLQAAGNSNLNNPKFPKVVENYADIFTNSFWIK